MIGIYISHFDLGSVNVGESINIVPYRGRKMNKKYQKIRQKAKEKSLLRARRKEESRRRFLESRKEHIKKTLKDSMIQERIAPTFDKSGWGQDKSSSTKNVLDNQNTGFNKDLFSDGK